MQLENEAIFWHENEAKRNTKKMVVNLYFSCMHGTGYATSNNKIRPGVSLRLPAIMSRKSSQLRIY